MNAAPATSELSALCAAHLQREEELLKAAEPILRALQGCFANRGLESLNAVGARLPDLAIVLADIQARRRNFREDLARRLPGRPNPVTLESVVNMLPSAERMPLRTQLDRVRRLAAELVSTNHRLAVHLRIHLDAYQRLLRDLTSAGSDPGRYGPGGTVETSAFRPLIQLHG